MHLSKQYQIPVDLSDREKGKVSVYRVISTCIGKDTYFAEAGQAVIQTGKATIGTLQRMLKIGFWRADGLMNQLLEAGVVAPEEGLKPRSILMSMDELERYLLMQFGKYTGSRL